MKNFIMTKIIKPKSEREPITAEDVMTMVALLIVPIYMTLYLIVLHLHDVHDDLERAKRVDMCRIKSVVIDDNYEKTYLCASEKIGNNEYIIIYENESLRVDENPYINRPVIIYKDGSVW